MHEHLLIGWPGWESHAHCPGPNDHELFSLCIDRIAEIKDHGVTAMLDPCPNDLGRNVELMAKVAQHTHFQIICATGLYKEEEGGAPYWKFRANFGDSAEPMAELFIHELQEGIGTTGIRAGIIKVATGHGAITDYEKTVLRAAAMAAVETGAPITTHTDKGKLGDQQQTLLIEHGVAPHKIIIGHSCGSSDHDYHMAIARNGSYLGFDRFGIEAIRPDKERVDSLLRLLRAGAGARVIVSHDSVWCWRGQPIPSPAIAKALSATWNPTHFFTRIVPQLLEGGATQEQIEVMLVDNPRRFFAGEVPDELAQQPVEEL
jgi:phosphotriesterase-related protein